MPENISLRDKLIADAEAYCERRGISLARLATIVANDGKFFVRLKAGGDCATRVYERFQQHFQEAA